MGLLPVSFICNNSNKSNKGIKMSWQNGGRKPVIFETGGKANPGGLGKLTNLLPVLSLVLVLVLTCFNPWPVQAETTGPAPAENLFKATWSEADGPIVAGEANRSWLWGPGPFTSQTEEYREAPDGHRAVMYFDKGRMELTHPDTGTVTLGLLVYELISGQLQLGDNTYSPARGGPANTNVVGDPGNWLTYARLQPYASLNLDNRAADRTGQTVDEQLTEKDGLQPATGRAGQQVIAYYDTVLGHNIPKIFWNFINQPGLVYDPAFGGYLGGQPVSWLNDVGYPLTEPYWVNQKVAGTDKDVLVQAFQRRVLTFTPDNPPAYQVEMGNVGRHYAFWRYGQDFAAAPAWPAPVVNPDSLREIVRGKTGQKKVAITLDAGSTAVAFPKQIAALDKHNVKITFFLTGLWAQQNPALARQIADDGMEIGNHSFDHPDFTKISDTQARDELDKAAQAIQEASGRNPWPLFRFPYGARDARTTQLVNDMGYRSVFWTYDSLDSVDPPKSAAFLVSRITGLSDSQLDGAIILMHLGNATSGDALDPILTNLQGRGFNIVTVSELIK